MMSFTTSVRRNAWETSTEEHLQNRNKKKIQVDRMTHTKIIRQL